MVIYILQPISRQAILATLWKMHIYNKLVGLFGIEPAIHWPIFEAEKINIAQLHRVNTIQTTLVGATHALRSVLVTIGMINKKCSYLTYHKILNKEKNPNGCRRCVLQLKPPPDQKYMIMQTETKCHLDGWCPHEPTKERKVSFCQWIKYARSCISKMARPARVW